MRDRLGDGLSFTEIAEVLETTKGAIGAVVRDYIRPGAGHRKLRDRPLSIAEVDFYDDVDMSKTDLGHSMIYEDHLPGRDCTWPLWKDDFVHGHSFVCGLPVEKGRYYCSGHTEMSKGELNDPTEKKGE